MDQNKLERILRKTLHDCADGLQAPETLDARLQHALRSAAPAPVRRMAGWKKRVLALAAVAAIAVTGAFAGGLGSITSHAWVNQRMDYDQTAARMTAVCGADVLPETLEGGFAFRYGASVETVAEYGGKSEQRDEVEAVYEKDGVQLHLSVHLPYTVFDGTEANNPVPAQTNTVSETTLTFRDAQYKFVPPDYEKTAEDRQAEADGTLVISFGTDEVEYRTHQSVQWERDGVAYLLSGFDTGLDAQTMFDMAAGIIG